MTTELQARAEVIGYPEPVLEAVRGLVCEVNTNPEQAAFVGFQMSNMGPLSEPPLMRVLAHLLTTIAAHAALTERQNQ